MTPPAFFTAIAASAALVACSATVDGDASDSNSQSQPIIFGTASDASQNAVVFVGSLQMQGAQVVGFGACTGTLIAPNLVLTARHCVSETSEQIGCGPKGAHQDTVGTDHAPQTLLIATGTKYPTGEGDVRAKGKKIFHEKSDTLCAHDISLILLDVPLKNVPIAQIRLNSAVKAGELFTAVGWGETDNRSRPQPSVRMQRAGIKVLGVGEKSSSLYGYIPPGDFAVGESICSGDSGGPAISEKTQAVIGVVSRGGGGDGGKDGPPPEPTSENDWRAEQAAGIANCEGDGAINLYTSTSGHKELILQAFAEAGYDPWEEGGPDPRLAKFGDACKKDADCRSNLCLLAPGAADGVCSQKCDDTALCPDTYDCSPGASTDSVCVLHVEPPPPVQAEPVTTTVKGCTVSSASSKTSGGGPLAIAFAMAVSALYSRRRRTRAR